jgi:hypothetical protein
MVSKMDDTALDGLVGRSFHVFGDDGTIEYQGAIVAQVGPEHYLVQYFEWAAGQESTLAVVALDDMTCSPSNNQAPWTWQFYENEAHMREWYEKHAEELRQLAAQREADEDHDTEELPEED